MKVTARTVRDFLERQLRDWKRGWPNEHKRIEAVQCLKWLLRHFHEFKRKKRK